MRPPVPDGVTFIDDDIEASENANEPKSNKDLNLRNRRCGVRFRRLSKEQKDQLHYLLKVIQ